MEELIMAKHYDKQFKLDAIEYYLNHKDLGLQGCASNLGISQQTLSRWKKNCKVLEILNAVALGIFLLMKKKKLQNSSVSFVILRTHLMY